MTRVTPDACQAQFGNGPPFAAGSVRGVRVWTVQDVADQGYTLIGSFHGIWHDGENVAECRVGQHAVFVPGLGFMGMRRYASTHGEPTPCAGVEPDCTCGFYAYWTWSPRDYPYAATYAVGIIEGYGRTVIGNLGFRCEKAKIVALAPRTSSLLPHDVTEKRTARIREAVRNRHPGVPVYESVEAMLAAHPPDDPPENVEPQPSDHLDPGAVAALVATAGVLGAFAALGSAIEWVAKRLRKK